MRTLRPNLDRFKQVQGSQTMKDFAGRIGVDQSTLSRVLTGKSEPGPRFIASTLLSLALTFNDLYEAVDTR